jgi:hypothetical protein
MDNLYQTRFVNEHFPPANKQVAIGETKHRCNKEGKAVFLTKTKLVKLSSYICKEICIRHQVKSEERFPDIRRLREMQFCLVINEIVAPYILLSTQSLPSFPFFMDHGHEERELSFFTLWPWRQEE